MRHSHHTRRHHDTDGMYSPNGFSLHALWHAIGRERYREGRDGRGGRGDGRGYDRADDRAHGRAERGFEDFAGAGRGSPYPDRFSLHALWHAIGHHHRGASAAVTAAGASAAPAASAGRRRRFSARPQIQLGRPAIAAAACSTPSRATATNSSRRSKRARTASTARAPAWSIPRSPIWKNSAT